MTKYNYKTQPYEHQRQALIQGACQNNYAYFMEMGTGKTKVSIDNVAYLHQQNKIDAVLVVAPNSVYRNWINEIETHCPVKTNIGVHKLSKSFENEGTSFTSAANLVINEDGISTSFISSSNPAAAKASISPASLSF